LPGRPLGKAQQSTVRAKPVVFYAGGTITIGWWLSMSNTTDLQPTGGEAMRINKTGIPVFNIVLPK